MPTFASGPTSTARPRPASCASPRRAGGHELHRPQRQRRRSPATWPPATSPATTPRCCPRTRRRTPSTRSPGSTASARSRTFAPLLARHFVESQPAIHRRAGQRRGVPLGVASTARPLASPAHGRRDPHRRVHHDARPAPRSCPGVAGPGAAQVDRLGVPRLRPGRLHHPAGDPRPDPRHRGRARWRHAEAATGTASYETARAALLGAFADTYSLALQQTLYAMGARRARAACPGSARCGCRCRTGTTSWWTWRRSGWTTPTRCSTPPTGPTG